MSFTNRRAKRLRQRRAEHHAPPAPEYPLPDGEVAAEEGDAHGDVPRHSRRGRRTHPRGRALAVATVGVLAFAGSAAGIAFSDIQQNIDRHDIGDLLGRNRPDVVDTSPADPASGEALNVLVIGSDQRDADDPDSESVDGMRSDTTMIAHVSADRDRVDVVSIPRDTLVDIPSCTLPNGRTTEPQTDEMFNSAFTHGGQTGNVGAAAACTISTVEQLTDVFIDDFVVVDFNGFTTMIEALDGVPMAIEQPIDDPQAHLQLAAGCQLLDAEEALGYARVRKTVGSGSDIDRIGRQQDLVAAIARDALSRNLLTELPVLYRFLDAATSSLVTGQEIGSLPTLAGLAYSLRGLDADDIYFTTMPFEWAGPRVVPSEEAELVWQALRNDEPVAEALQPPAEEPTPGEEPEEPVDPEEPSPAPTDDGPTRDATADEEGQSCTRADV